MRMKIPYFQVDAFTKRRFGGNPAGVCLLQKWLPDAVLQNMAMEHNLSETAFLVRGASGWNLRWFTPQMEVDLCGHATLASAFVLFFERHFPQQTIYFQTLSGRLAATRLKEIIELDCCRWAVSAIC